MSSGGSSSGHSGSSIASARADSPEEEEEEEEEVIHSDVRISPGDCFGMLAGLGRGKGPSLHRWCRHGEDEVIS
jgi:hypothetical protein